MGDRYPPRHGHPPPRDRYDADRRYGYEDRYASRDRYDHYERPRPRSRSPPRRGYDAYDRFDDRRNGRNERNDGYRRNDGYNFRGAADRGQTYRPAPPQSDFTFRAAASGAPKFPLEQRPAPQPLEARIKTGRRDQGKRVPPGQQGGRPFDAGARGRFRKPPPHQRDILRRQGGSRTPEQLHGMNQDGHVRFGEANFSSSEEEGSEDGEIDDSAMDEGEGPRKRVKSVVAESTAQAAPKWSNPEYFTALPPPESGLGPKKDIVQVIRKAKIEAAPKQDSANAVKENADFISFSMDDDVVDFGGMKLSDTCTEAEPQQHKRQRKPKDTSIDTTNAAKDIKPEPQEDTANQSGPKAALTAPLKSRTETTIEPEEEIAPKKRPFKQFVSPKPPFRGFKLPKADVRKDPGSPPRPPSGIDQIMGLADRMKPKAPPSAKAVPQQSSEPKGKKRKAALISKGLGDIVADWVNTGTNPTPWCTVDHTRTASVGFRLHKEIADFYEFVRPHDYEEAVRRDLIQRVQRAVRAFKVEDATRVEIKSFGSFASGVYLPTADMDLVAVSPQYLQTGRKQFCQSSNSKLHKLGHHLTMQNLVTPGTITVVTKAKVPIVKFTEKKSGIKVDISFENDTGLIALNTFAEWKEKYPAMPVIVVLIKQMLAMRGLNEVFLGGLGGFSIICLVVSMMQMMPEVQSGNMDTHLHYSDLLLNFLDLYGNKFNLRTTGITMEPPGYFDKIRYPHKRQNHNGLTIIDPNNPENDISGGSNKIATVFDCFRVAHSEIQRRLAQIHSGENIEDSILGVVLAGNYTSFISQRNRLSLLHSGQPISSDPLSDVENYDDLQIQDEPKRKGGPPGRGRGGRARGAGGNLSRMERRRARETAPGPEQPYPTPRNTQDMRSSQPHPLPPKPVPNGVSHAAPKRRR